MRAVGCGGWATRQPSPRQPNRKIEVRLLLGAGCPRSVTAGRQRAAERHPDGTAAFINQRLARH